MKLASFAGADQMGPVCQVRWEGGSSPSLLIYCPQGMAGPGKSVSSPKQAADQYAGQSPKGGEPVPGLEVSYMVFDPKTPNRRVFAQHQGKVSLIVSQDQVPLAALAKAIVP